MPGRFTVEETNMMCIFDTGGRDALIPELTAALPRLEEPGLREIAESAIAKLGRMGEGEIRALDLHPEYGDEEESEAQ
jgi:hypothetical protein